MTDRLAEIKANTWSGDGAVRVHWLIAEAEKVERLEATITDMTRGNTGQWGKRLHSEGMEAAAVIADRHAKENEDGVTDRGMLCERVADDIRATAKGTT